MRIPKISSIKHRLIRIFKHPDSFLKHSKGVIHVGANKGQEGAHYHKLGLNVLWIEPIPEVFDQLKSNIGKYDNQHAIQALISDKDDERYDFNIANNGGASSSLLKLHKHEEIWPDVQFSTSIEMASITLETLFDKNEMDKDLYDTLIIDTQGSELKVLQGAGYILDMVNHIKVEAADFEAYKNCCQVQDIRDFLQGRKYKLAKKYEFIHKPGIGSYYDLVFTRTT